MGVRFVKYTDRQADELNRLINSIYPAVVLFDACFFEDITARKIGCLLREVPGLNIAVFNFLYITPEKAALFVRYGVKSYFDMSGSGSFWRGLKTVLRGKEYITPSVRKAIEDMPDSTRDLRLDTTARTEDVKLLVFRGLRTKEIADALRVSIKTVENEKTALFAMYGVKSALALFRQCFLMGELDRAALAVLDVLKERGRDTKPWGDVWYRPRNMTATSGSDATETGD